MIPRTTTEWSLAVACTCAVWGAMLAWRLMT